MSGLINSAGSKSGVIENYYSKINQPAFSVWSSDSNQTVGQAAWTTWAHNQTELDNKGGVHANNYYEVQSGDNGYWFLIGTVHWGGTIESTETIAGAIFLNSTEIQSVWASPTFGGGDNMFCTVNAIVNASVGSKFYLNGWHSGASTTVMMNGSDKNTTFMGFKLLI